MNDKNDLVTLLCTHRPAKGLLGPNDLVYCFDLDRLLA